MGNLFIRKIKYYGDNYWYESPSFTNGIHILEGDNRTGKTTFSDLIYFGLGGSVEQFKKEASSKHLEITSDTNNYVELDIQLNNLTYTFQRYIGKNVITIMTEESKVLAFPINRRASEKIFSDWLLEQLNIAIIEVFQGIKTFKINFKDLARLIYYDQSSPAKKVYKNNDSDNFVSDSEEVRKIIFQLLMGNTFSELYKAIAEFKEVERKKLISKNVLEEYSKIADALVKTDERQNLVALNNKKNELTRQLENLINLKKSLRENNLGKNEVSRDIESVRNNIESNELEIINLKSKRLIFIEERISLGKLKENKILEVTQIEKIILAHDHLSLFSVDTCPYCLKNIKRVKGHCVCGNDVNEEDYERFFFKSDEYADILRSRLKSIETIELSLTSSSRDLSLVEEEIKILTKKNEEFQDKIRTIISTIESKVDLNAIEEIDDGILKARSELQTIDQLIEIETKRSYMQKEFDALDSELNNIRNRKLRLESSANEDITAKVDAFSAKYKEILELCLNDVNAAKIKYDDYMPSINNDEYREFSSIVPIKLMYYYTLLYMSLKFDDVKFPKFLLIDNPETAGIDINKLKDSIKQVLHVVSGDNYQVILTTAINKYPNELKEYVFDTLKTDNKLLRQREKI